MESLADRVRRLEALKIRRAQMLADHVNADAAIAQEVRDLQTSISSAALGLDEDLVRRGFAVLDVSGEIGTGGLDRRTDDDRGTVARDALSALALAEHPGGSLWSEFFGTKHYDRWLWQRCDCGYGMGPRHGSINFSIGLRADVRAREVKTLSPEEVEAAIYVVANLERIQQAQRDGMRAAREEAGR